MPSFVAPADRAVRATLYEPSQSQEQEARIIEVKDLEPSEVWEIGYESATAAIRFEDRGVRNTAELTEVPPQEAPVYEAAQAEIDAGRARQAELQELEDNHDGDGPAPQSSPRATGDEGGTKRTSTKRAGPTKKTTKRSAGKGTA